MKNFKAANEENRRNWWKKIIINENCCCFFQRKKNIQAQTEIYELLLCFVCVLGLKVFRIVVPIKKLIVESNTHFLAWKMMAWK